MFAGPQLVYFDFNSYAPNVYFSATTALPSALWLSIDSQYFAAGCFLYVRIRILGEAQLWIRMWIRIWSWIRGSYCYLLQFLSALYLFDELSPPVAPQAGRARPSNFLNKRTIEILRYFEKQYKIILMVLRFASYVPCNNSARCWFGFIYLHCDQDVQKTKLNQLLFCHCTSQKECWLGDVHYPFCIPSLLFVCLTYHRLHVFDFEC